MEVIHKFSLAGNLGVPVEYWRINAVSANFEKRTLAVELYGWTSIQTLRDGYNPIFVLTMEFSPAMVQMWQRDYITNTPDAEPPDFSALRFDVPAHQFNYDLLVNKVLNHPSFNGATLVNLEEEHAFE